MHSYLIIIFKIVYRESGGQSNERQIKFSLIFSWSRPIYIKICVHFICTNFNSDRTALIKYHTEFRI